MEVFKVVQDIFETIDDEKSDQEAMESIADWRVSRTTEVTTGTRSKIHFDGSISWTNLDLAKDSIGFKSFKTPVSSLGINSWESIKSGKVNPTSNNWSDFWRRNCRLEIVDVSVPKLNLKQCWKKWVFRPKVQSHQLEALWWFVWRD